MPVVPVAIPQLGEGLQEARLVELLKQPGDAVRRDEPIYVMETDKAMSEVESPYAGTLVEWTAEVDSILPIGAEIAKMEVSDEVAASLAGSSSGHGSSGQGSPGHGHATAAGSTTTSTGSSDSASTATQPSSTTASSTSAGNATSGVLIPPKTRKYLVEKGLLEVADQIPATGSKLMPEDVDRYLSSGGNQSSATVAATTSDDFAEKQLPNAQVTLNSRMLRGTQACVPATIVVDIDWTALAAARKEAKQAEGETSFSMLCYCVAQAMKEKDSFRSSITGEGKLLRTYHHVNLGVAVSLPGDLLKTAVVRKADTLSKRQFHDTLVEQIEIVRGGTDQIDATTTVTVSNIGASGVNVGIPVVVTPAVATIALGTIRNEAVPTENGGVTFRQIASMVMTFDHRIVNGVGAAAFVAKIKELAENYSR